MKYTIETMDNELCNLESNDEKVRKKASSYFMRAACKELGTKDTKQINYLYLYHFLHSSYIEKQLSSGMDGGTQKFISLGNVRNLYIMYPSDVEQVKLGHYFESLDHLITLHQRK